MTKKAELVEERYSHENCAQTVFSLLAKDLVIDEEMALKIASGFAGGMACAETCGAVTGSYMVIGLKHGHSGSDPDEKAKTKEIVQKFNKAFEEKHGSLICKKLVGYDISTEEGMEGAREKNVFNTKCPEFIKSACTILEEDFEN